MKESKFVSAVIYLHNDAGRVDGFLTMITRLLAEKFSKYELIFVNDASEDSGIAEIYDFFEKNEMDSQMVSIVQMGHYQGQETSMNAGRDISIGDFVYEFDDMLIDYDPELIFDAYRKTAEGMDIVSVGCSEAASLSSRMFYNIYNRTSGSTTKIGTDTFRILSRRAVNRVRSIGQYIPYRKAVYANCGLNASWIDYKSTRSAGERRKETARRHERQSLATDSLIYFTNVMEKLSQGICVLFALVAICVICDILYETIALTNPVEGWRSTMGFLSVGFFGIFLILSIILRYLSVLLNLIFKKQRYLTAGVEKIAPKK